MSGLRIFTSNRLEILVERLAQIIKEPLLSSLAPEVIVVQSRGMQRWVSMELARHNGICANCDFPFPNAFLQNFFKKIMPDLPQDSPFEPNVMTFKIMKVLPRLMNRPDFKDLKKYLKDDANKIKLFQLSAKIADTFDQYLVFRPEMIFSWEADGSDARHEDSWQAYLWRELTRGSEKLHRAWLRKTLFEKITNMSLDREEVSQRMSVFGISYLPPFYLRTIAVISRLMQVNLFILNPCMEYWSDIVSDKEMRKIKGRYSQKELMEDDLHLEKGNRLLASLGVLGRNFMALIGEFDSEISEQFEDQNCNTILACVQSDIFHLRERPEANDRHTVVKQTTDHLLEDQSEIRKTKKTNSKLHHPLELDTSIQIHSCHSPLREMEVLFDNLLAMFDEDPDLLPKDVVVMTPDIETYAPYVQIVFDAPKEDSLKIPYSIADKSVKKDSRLIETLLAILDLKTSRFGADQVLGLLQIASIREKFGLSASDVEKAERWVQEINIRWGIDSSSRSKLGFPKFSENTWKAGIQRFLLGYAMPGHDEILFKGILPYDKIEGAEVKVLGKFLNFLEWIFSCRDNLEKPRSLRNWHFTLQSILDQFFLPDEAAEREIQFIRRVLDNLIRLEDLSGYDNNVELEVIQSYLGDQFDKSSFGYGFLKGGVTFCAMLPMRSIPFNVICLVGMNSEAFPREDTALGFDLIAKHPRAGDRSRRNDDKYLFLEAIISARKKLYISFVGQNIQDNTRIPPSPLVSELMDTLKDGFGVSKDQLVVYHRLQPFNPTYFQQDTQLFSYSRDNLIAARHLNNQKNCQPFISTEISTPGDEWKHIVIENLCAFYANPAKFLLQQRLGIFLDEGIPLIDDKENFSLDGLQKYQIGQDLVKRRLSGSNLKNDLPIQIAKGLLPHGNVGRYFYGEMSHEADIFIRKVEKFTADQQADDMDIDLDIKDYHLTGRLTGIHRHGLIRIRYANKRAKDLVSSWIYHLVMCCLLNGGDSRKTILLCKDSTWEFQPVNAAGEIMESLVSLFWQGLSKPVHFFPELSYAYVHQLTIKKKTLQTARKAVNNKWVGNEFKKGESEDPYFKLCFRNMNPIDHDFQQLAEKVFSPILAHCVEIKE